MTSRRCGVPGDAKETATDLAIAIRQKMVGYVPGLAQESDQLGAS